jgi:cardiolipin synthase
LTRNLPNLLTAARLAVVPVIAFQILNGHFRTALLLTFLAGMTDIVDGFLARRFHSTSRLGAWLDPLADKGLLVTLFLTLGWIGVFSWWLVGLVFARDAVILLMVGAAFAFTTIRDFPPSKWGKLSTFLQLVACGGMLVIRSTPFAWPPVVSVILIAATSVGTVWSGIDYVRLGIARWRREQTSPTQTQTR